MAIDERLDIIGESEDRIIIALTRDLRVFEPIHIAPLIHNPFDYSLASFYRERTDLNYREFEWRNKEGKLMSLEEYEDANVKRHS